MLRCDAAFFQSTNRALPRLDYVSSRFASDRFKQDRVAVEIGNHHDAFVALLDFV